MVEVIPVSMTQVDWPTYLRTCLEVTKTNPAKNLDAAGIPIKTPFSFIASLDCFKGGIESPNNAVRDAGFSLRHFSFGFLILCGRGCRDDLSSYSDLAIDDGGQNLYLVTGTLLQWQQTLLTNLSNKKLPCSEFRDVLNRVISLLEQAGLVDLFRGFRKTSQSDGTFLLEAQ